MGFRTGAYAKVWEVTPMSDTSTKVRMSVSRKNKQTGEYEQDFSIYNNIPGLYFASVPPQPGKLCNYMRAPELRLAIAM